MIYGRAIEQQHEPANEEIYQDLCLVGVYNRHEVGEFREKPVKKQKSPQRTLNPVHIEITFIFL